MLTIVNNPVNVPEKHSYFKLCLMFFPQLMIIEKKFKLLMDNKLFDYIEVMNGTTANIITVGISHNSKITREIASSLYEYTIGAKK